MTLFTSAIGALRSAKCISLGRSSRWLIALLLASGSLCDQAAGQANLGKEANVPPRDPPPTDLFIDNAGGRYFTFFDGDPATTDAPRVHAVAGGGRITFGDYYLTAKNILIWADDAAGAADGKNEPTFPYGPDDPVVLGSGIRVPSLDALSGSPLLPGFGSTGESIGQVREIYAEGNVYIEQKTPGGKNVFQATRAYFNIIEDRSLIIDGEIRTDLNSTESLTGGAKKDQAASGTSETNQATPIVIRAAEIRGVARGLLEADNAKLTTCTFGEPGYHVAVDHIIYEQRATELSGRATGIGNELIVHGQPLVALPYLEVRTGAASPFPLIGLRVGGSSKLGLFIKTKWGNEFEQAGLDFNNWLGVEGKFNGSWYVDINLYSKRGLGLGGGIEYETTSLDKNADNKIVYEGATDLFFINDISGDDETGNTNNEGFRGRFKTLNRVYLPEAWRLDTEINYVSDENVIREFLDNDSELRREPETMVYVRKLDKDTAVTSTLRYRLNPWQTQTEYLPQATYDVISRPIAEFETLGEALNRPDALRLYWTHRSEVGFVNRLVSDELNDDDFDEFDDDNDDDENNNNNANDDDNDSENGKHVKHSKSKSKAHKPFKTAKANELDDDLDKSAERDSKSNDPFLDAREEQFRAEGSAFRLDDIERLNLPFDIGPVAFDPYFENRLTAWFGDADIDGGGGGFREGMTVGFNTSTQYWKTIPDFESEFFNLHGLRHIVIPNIRYRYTFLATEDSNDLVPYDAVERFDTLNAIVPGVRSRYQTKRMTRYGKESVTFLDIDVQQPYIFENGRQESLADLLEDDQDNGRINENETIDDGTGFGDFWLDVRYRPDIDHYLFEHSYLRSTLAWNWHDSQLDKYSIELTTEPGPDFFARIGYSWAQAGSVSPSLALDGFLLNRESDRDLNSLKLEFGYQLTRRWEIAVRDEIDLPSFAVTSDLRVILRRSTHDWLFEIDVGALGGGTGFGMSVVPLAFAKRDGHERFKTALSDGYDITPLFDTTEYSVGPALSESPAESP